MGLQEHIRFTQEEKIYFEENFEPFHLKKGHYLITKDELVEHFYYLEEGILNICFPQRVALLMHDLWMTGHS